MPDYSIDLHLNTSDPLEAVKKLQAEITKLKKSANGSLAGIGGQGSLNSVNKQLKETNTLIGNLWKRFGQVAIGFSVFYRAINMVEMGLYAMTGTIKEAIKLSGELSTTQAKLAMWMQMIAGETQTYGEAYEKAEVYMQRLQEASLTSLSTISEIATTLDEMAQAGVIFGSEKMKEVATLTDFVIMVAQTTGNTERQVRQEVQALFTGKIRAENQLLRTLINFGVITDEEIKQLKRLTNQGEIAAKAMEVVNRAMEPVLEKVMLNDPSIAFGKWKDTIIFGYTQIITQMKKMDELSGGEGNNPFAQVIVKHRQLALEMSNVERAGKQALMETLVKGLDVALSAGKGFLRVLENIALLLKTVVAAIEPFKEEIATFAKILAFTAAVAGLKLVAKLMVKLIKGMKLLLSPTMAWVAALLLAVNTIKVLVERFGELEKIGQQMDEHARIAADWADKTFAGEDAGAPPDSTYTKEHGTKDFFGDVITSTEEMIDKFSSAISQMFKGILPEGEAFNELMDDVDGTLREGAEAADDFSKELAQIQKRINDLTKTESQQTIIGLADEIATFTEKLGSLHPKVKELKDAVVAHLGKDLLKDVSDALDESAKETGLKIRNIIPEALALNKMHEDVANAFKELEENIRPILLERFGALGEQIADVIFERLSVASEKAEQALGADTARNLYDTMVTKKQKKALSDISDIQQQQIFILSFRKQLGLTNNEVEALSIKVKHLIADIRWDAGLDEDNVFAGISHGLREYADAGSSFAETISDAVVDSFQSMEDALVEFVTTGEISFSGMVDSILADLARIAIRKSITEPLAGALESINWSAIFSAKGGVFSGKGIQSLSGGVYDKPTVFGFAKGGTIGVLGEGKKSEAVMPLETMSNGDLGVQANLGMPSVNVNIINNAGVNVETNNFVDDSGGLTVEAVLDKKMSKVMSTPGTATNKLLGGANRTIISRR